MYAMIQDEDTKSRNLAKNIPNIELYGMKGSTNIIPIHIIKQILKRKKRPKAVILRYLNDSHSFAKSVIRFITNIFTVLLAKILRIKLIWICHNVDHESKEYYPFLVNIRRKLVAKLSDRILVTDKLLIKHAANILKVDQSKLDYITFGEPELSKTIYAYEEIHKGIKEFIQNNQVKKTLVCLSIGNPNKKVLHPFYTDQLVKEFAKRGFNLKVILGGPLGDFIKNQDVNTYNNILSNPNILFLDGKITLDERYISQYIDFYWRVYDDYSVPFTVYNAAYLKKPILTMNTGFLKEMVSEYDLGGVLENDMSNLHMIIDKLVKNNTVSFDKFIEDHNWTHGASKLYAAINE